jgi:RHS repeat-associated protein
MRYWYGLRDMNDIARRQRYSSGTTLQDDRYALRETMNVVALVESSGSVQHRMAYDAFGTVRFLDAAFNPGANSTEWKMLSHGHYRDAETGLYQMRYRYYHPRLGVWLSRDPIKEFGGLNLYGFVASDSINYWDDLGLAEIFVSKSCPAGILENYRYYDEDEMPNILRRLPNDGKVDQVVDADALYYPDGKADKLWNFASIRIYCYCVRRKWIPVITGYGIIGTWKSGEVTAPFRWPGLPPYVGRPPKEPIPLRDDEQGPPGPPTDHPPLNPRSFPSRPRNSFHPRR